MPTPLHNLQSPAFNSRFNDSIAVVWWRMVCSFAKLFSSGQLPGKSRKFFWNMPSSCLGVWNLTKITVSRVSVFFFEKECSARLTAGRYENDRGFIGVWFGSTTGMRRSINFVFLNLEFSKLWITSNWLALGEMSSCWPLLLSSARTPRRQANVHEFRKVLRLRRKGLKLLLCLFLPESAEPEWSWKNGISSFSSSSSSQQPSSSSSSSSSLSQFSLSHRGIARIKDTSTFQNVGGPFFKQCHCLVLKASKESNPICCSFLDASERWNSSKSGPVSSFQKLWNITPPTSKCDAQGKKHVGTLNFEKTNSFWRIKLPPSRKQKSIYSWCEAL